MDKLSLTESKPYHCHKLGLGFPSVALDKDKPL